MKHSDFRLDGWRVSPSRNQVVKNGHTARLEPKVMGVLVFLAENQGRVLSREEIEQAVWPNAILGDKTLTRAVSEIRRALNDDAKSPRIIETVARRGYVLSQDVVWEAANAETVQTRYLSLFVAVLIVALLAWFYNWDRVDATRWKPADRLTTASGLELTPAVSPGGDLVAFAWQNTASSTHIYIKQSEGEQPLQLTHSSSFDISPVWSPEGDQIAFLRYGENQCQLMLVPALGGTARHLADCNLSITRPNFAPTIDWSKDGRWLVYSDLTDNGEGLWLYDLESGQSNRLTQPDGYRHRDPAFSPDGSKLVFTRINQGVCDLFLLDLESNELQRLTEDYRSILGSSWLSDNQLVFSSNRGATYDLWQFDLSSEELTWLPMTGWNKKRPRFSHSAGKLVYEDWIYDTNIWLSSLSDLSVDSTALAASTMWDYQPAWSPDGRSIVFISNREGNFDLWLRDMESGSDKPLTQMKGWVLSFPQWSPDGKSILFQARKTGDWHIYQLNVDNHSLRQLSTPRNAMLPSWSKDGQQIYYTLNDAENWSIWRMDISSTEKQRLVRGFNGKEGMDGELFFTHHGLPGLWVQDSQDSEARLLVTEMQVGQWANWLLDSEHIWYVNVNGPSDQLIRRTYSSDDSESIFSFPKFLFAYEPGFSLSPDRQSIAYTQLDRVEADIMLVTAE